MISLNGFLFAAPRTSELYEALLGEKDFCTYGRSLNKVIYHLRISLGAEMAKAVDPVLGLELNLYQSIATCLPDDGQLV